MKKKNNLWAAVFENGRYRIFTTWEACKSETDGESKVMVKGFLSRKAAQEWVNAQRKIKPHRHSIPSPLEAQAVAAIKDSVSIDNLLRGEGWPFGQIQRFLFDELHLATIPNGFGIAYPLVPIALNKVYGSQKSGGWHTVNVGGKIWVRSGSQPTFRSTDQTDPIGF